MRAAPFVDEKMPQRCEQERAETSAFGTQIRESFIRDDTCEKFLRAIFGFVVGSTLSTRECIKWIPVQPAQRFESHAHLRFRTRRRMHDKRPARRGERSASNGKLLGSFGGLSAGR